MLVRRVVNPELLQRVDVRINDGHGTWLLF